MDNVIQNIKDQIKDNVLANRTLQNIQDRQEQNDFKRCHTGSGKALRSIHK